MQEKGEIQMLYDKWWKKSEETCVRDEKKMETTKANSLVCRNKFSPFSDAVAAWSVLNEISRYLAGARRKRIQALK